jgi:glucan-binding YG repeat protein
VSSKSGSWSHDGTGWHYTENGVPVKNAWRYLSYNGLSYWYFFDENGTMKTGWFEQGGERYYLYPESDGWKGRMLTGWQQIGGKWYYFETAAGSTQGRMYHDERTPEGFWMGPDGAWDGNPANTGI